jgi:hypothetical protein
MLKHNVHHAGRSVYRRARRILDLEEIVDGCSESRQKMESGNGHRTWPRPYHRNEDDGACRKILQGICYYQDDVETYY